MKIRTGFVSNSSSSSFLLTGELINIDNIILNKNDKFVAIGEYLYDGLDIIVIDNYFKLVMVLETTEHFMVYNCETFMDVYSFDLYNILNISEGDDEQFDSFFDLTEEEQNIILTKKIGKNTVMVEIDDHNSNNNFELYLKRYNITKTEKDFEKLANKYLRLEKLKRVLNH
jgi:hypothetical protein